MAVLDIKRFGAPVLRERATPVKEITDLHRRLISNMMDTMRAAPGIGLAAPQVGVLDRIFVWEVDDSSGVAINPVLVEVSDDRVEDVEGCLSIPGLTYPVERAARVTLEGLDQEGNPLRIEAEELLAVVFQHEIDHLDGVLFIDHLDEELRREAMRTLRDIALGLQPLPTTVAEDTL